MRSTVLIVFISFSILVLVNEPLEAQIEQDQWLIGASSNLSFRSTSNDVLNDQRSINLTTKFGYFFHQNLALGLDLGMTYLDVGNSSTTEINVGPFARYYFQGLFFAGLGYSVVHINRKLDSNSGSDNGGALALEAGHPIWVLIECLSIEPTLRYNIGTGDLLKGTNSLSLNIGLVLYF
ncbi:hypothetical protein BFP97_00040 [Roseivirga sp. 4D4]|uniref:hypothetical protein n=1 Tax=Roseivirga sp. 4D4 TaxID=1889784 RepID=UPI00085336CC|nr:hypothetical protein [Roseivirga sp. 4D4]OEK00005.1 hypothetical protein BFP97_00040 [Roseivirga sp. 4D4]